MAFLSNYTNSAREALPTHKLYPMGQRMKLGAWNPYFNDIQKMADNGFTCAGPWENT